MRELLTVAELAHKLKVHRHSLYRLIGKRAIPYLKIPGVGIRFDSSKIERWAKESESQVENWSEKLKAWRVE